MSAIHPSAHIADGARIAPNVSIGPFCVVGPHVALDEGVELLSHVVVEGCTKVGARTKIYPFASIGHPPQDLKYRGEDSTLVVGADCILREGVTINPGTAGGGLETIVGDHCALLAHAHVGHDCRLGAHVVLSNNVMLAGHVSVGDHAILGGGVGVIQHARIGQHAFVGGLSGLEGDLIPFGLAFGNRAHLAGLNLVGLRRRDFSRNAIDSLRRAYRMLFAPEGTMAERIADVQSTFGDDANVAIVLDFLRAAADRPICKPREGQI